MPTVDAKRQSDATSTTGSSAWAPFRSPDFARMASAQFVSNVGSWMQTVGAQELMLTLTTSAALVALIQTAAGLPVVLLAAVGLALVALAGLWLPFKAIAAADLLPAGDWPDPRLLDADTTDGPILVTLEYRPRPG